LNIIFLIIAISILVFYINYLINLNWRSAVKAVFFILVIEGILRKWIFPQASDFIYFLKDLVLLGAYLNYYIFSNSQRQLLIKNRIVTVLIIFVAVWCTYEAFNPSLGSPLVALFGLKAYLFYIPLIWMLPNLFQSEEDLYKFLRSHLFLIIPVALLGILQFFSPPSSPLNLYTPGTDQGVATFGSEDNNSVRITGTFSYISTYGIYLAACFSLMIPMLFKKQSKLWHWITIVELLLLLVNSLMTGSRSTVFVQVLLLLGYFGIQFLNKPASTLHSFKKFLLPAIIVAIAASIWFRPAIDAFWLRTTSNQDVSGRVAGSFFEPIDFIKYTGLYGYGTGATHQATPMLRKILNLPPGEVIPVGFESEMGRVTLELGPFGFLFWYGLRVSTAIALWNVYLNLQRPFLRQLALTAFLFQAIQFNGPLVFNYAFSIYYWFVTGFIFLLPQLEQIENLQQYYQLSQTNGQSPYFPDSSN
jgi:hypothetical protein